MRRTIHKLFWAWDFDKEENWLNDMAAKGLVLVAVGACSYTFEESSEGRYNVRLELLDNVPSHAESQQYIKFIEATGAEYLGSVMRWVYFRKQTEHGEFDLYSDYDSRIKHLNRIVSLIGFFSILNICIGISSILTHVGTDMTEPVFIGLINLSFGLFIAFGCLHILLKKRKLQKEHRLFE